MEDFIMYEKYLEQLEEAGKTVTLKNVPSTAIKTMSLIFWNIRIRILKSLPVRMSELFCLWKKRKDWKPQPWISIILLSVFSIGMSCISFGMISRFRVWPWNINFRLYWPPLRLTVCYLLLTISNVRLCSQSCILLAWGFLKWSMPSKPQNPEV